MFPHCRRGQDTASTSCVPPLSRLRHRLSSRVRRYYQLVKRPIDLGAIKARVDGQGYFALAEFEADMRLLFANARAFDEATNHPADRLVSADADALEAAMDAAMAKHIPNGLKYNRRPAGQPASPSPKKPPAAAAAGAKRGSTSSKASKETKVAAAVAAAVVEEDEAAETPSTTTSGLSSNKEMYMRAWEAVRGVRDGRRERVRAPKRDPGSAAVPITAKAVPATAC